MAQAHPEEADLLAYVEEELDPIRRSQLAEHVGACPLCAGRVRELETARDALRASPLLRLPAERRAGLVERVSAPARARRARRPLVALVGALVAIAALLAVVATQENGPTVAGRGEDAAEEAAPQTGEAERSDDAGGSQAASGRAAPVARVKAPPSRVAELLRARGYDARVVDGAVEVRTTRPAAVRRLVTGRFGRGGVVVYVR